MVGYSEYPFDMRIRREAEALANIGYDVLVIAAQSGQRAKSDRVGPVRVFEVPLRIQRGTRARYFFQYIVFFLMSSAVLARIRFRGRIDMVHVHSLPDFQVFCAALFRLAGVPVVLDLHEALPEIFAARFNVGEKSFWFRAAAVLERLSCRFASRVVVANDGIGMAVISRGIPSSHVISVYNVGDPPIVSAEVEPLKASLGIPEEDIIVHAGGINPERDLETVVRAVAQLPQATKPCFVFAGDGNPTYIEHLQGVAAELGIEDRVKFVGRLPLDESRALMSLSLIGLVSASRNPLTELAWPTRVVEFSFLGKPLVVADLRFMRSVLGSAALYYTPGDPGSLSKQLSDVIEFPHRYARQVEEARRVCGTFTWSRMQRSLADVYVGLRVAPPAVAHISSESR